MGFGIEAHETIEADNLALRHKLLATMLKVDDNLCAIQLRRHHL